RKGARRIHEGWWRRCLIQTQFNKPLTISGSARRIRRSCSTYPNPKWQECQLKSPKESRFPRCLGSISPSFQRPHDLAIGVKVGKPELMGAGVVEAKIYQK